MHDEMLLCRLDFLQTKTNFLGFKPVNTHGKNLVIPMNLRLTMEHRKTQGDFTDFVKNILKLSLNL